MADVDGWAKEPFVRDLFNQIARRYDAMNLIMTGGAYRYWQRRFRRLAALAGHERVLDVGTGTADLCLLLAPDLRRGGRITGLDLAEEMLRVAAAKVARSPYRDRIELLQGNALSLPFPDASFDVVTTAFAMRNFAGLERALAEMRRVLKPGGRLLAMELTHPPSSLVRVPYFFYFRRVLPLLGFWAKKTGPYAPYAWLPASLQHHPDAPELARMLRVGGWRDVRWTYLTFGIVAVHQATR
ncbi:MAG: ubiquinone/menaquinone biosynthesis methyltransferase [Firmicutes bacterium]|nr:ubiquinone/menaquinone biosynthesis methyltransferase [Bacillota bacterium]